jgi:hypothetical protein
MSLDLEALSKIEGFLAEFSRTLSRPEQKFLKDLVFGILQSRSSLLSEIVRAICTADELEAGYKRLDTNLGYYDLTRAYERAQSRMLSRVDENTLFIFDPSEIVKPFAEKMEGLSRVRDASEKPIIKKSALGKKVKVPVLKPGYPLRVAVAMSSNGDLVPIELSLYSTASEFFDSRNDEYIQSLETLIHKADLQPILVLDREFDAFTFIRFLSHLRQRFIIRVTKNRKYRLAGVAISFDPTTYTREEITGKYAFLSAEAVITYSKKGKPREHLFQIKASYVELLSEQKKSGVFRDPGDLQALTLIQVRIKKEHKNPVIYLLTNARPKTPEDLIYIAKSYLARWNIEEYIRFIKQQFSLEDFLVRDLGRMKNLIRATYIATVVIHLLTDRSTKRGFTMHHHLIEQSLPVAPPKKSRDFFLYSYGRGLSNIVSLNKKLISPTNDRSKKSDNNAQLQFKIWD